MDMLDSYKHRLRKAAAAFCAAREQGCQRELPVRAPKKEKRLEEKTVFLLVRDGKIVRKQQG